MLVFSENIQFKIFYSRMVGPSGTTLVSYLTWYCTTWFILGTDPSDLFLDVAVLFGHLVMHWYLYVH